MSDKARYSISLALGWAIGGIFLAGMAGSGQAGAGWVPPVGFALTFFVTLAALDILRD